MSYRTTFFGQLYINKPVDHKIIRIIMEDDYSDIEVKPNPDWYGNIWCVFTPEKGKEHFTLGCAYDDEVTAYHKFEWLHYIYENILKPHGLEFFDSDDHNPRSQIYWEGEDADDFGVICAKQGRLLIRHGERVFQDPVVIEECLENT
jgi:hypothetical protein